MRTDESFRDGVFPEFRDRNIGVSRSFGTDETPHPPGGVFPKRTNLLSETSLLLLVAYVTRS